MDIYYERLHEDAKKPEKATSRDFCYDLYAVDEEEIAPNVWRYRLGLRIEMDKESFKNELLEMFNPSPSFLETNNFSKAVENFMFALDMRPRSSVWKTGMILANCEGTVDELYRGEIMAVFYHILPNMPRYKKGDKIVQAKVGITPKINWIEKGMIDTNTDRGVGGFGSSGK